MFAQDLIRRDIEIIDLHLKATHTAEEIRNYTQHLKNQIYNSLDGDTVDKIVFVDTNNFFIVVCSMIAAWELGGSIFLNDSDPKVKSLPYFQKFYQVIDVVIGDRESKVWLPESAIHVSTDQYMQEKTKPVELFDRPLAKPITQETVCYYTTSSGTTADPKILPFTHYQTVTISNEIDQYLNLTGDERPYHYKTLHHSSLFNSYALPLLNRTKTHYSGLFPGGAEQFLGNLFQQISQYKLTHFLCPYDWLRNINELKPIELESPLTLITIQGNTNEEMTKLLDLFNIKQVINYFGTSEVGTMFISRTTKDNVKDYNPNRFVDVTSYIDYEFLKNKVKVKWKHIDDWYVLGDKIVQEDDGTIWLYGRDIRLEWQGQEIEFIKLQEFVKQYLNSPEFILVPDYQREKIYLNLYNKKINEDDLKNLNIGIAQHFGEVFKIVDYFNFAPQDLQFGMKVNGPLLLYLFRERNK